MLTSQIPQEFTTFCHIAGLSDEKTKASWEKIWEKSLSDLLIWSNANLELTPDQLNSLDLASKKEGQKNTFWEVLLELLDSTQKQKAINQLVQLTIDNMTSFFDSIKETVPFDEKQVLNGYLNSVK